MPIKSTKRGLRRTYSLSKRWEQVGSILGLLLLAVGILLFLIGQSPANATSKKATVSQLNTSQSDTLIQEPEWGMWYKGYIGQSFPTTQHPYAIGQTVTIPKNVSIRVDRVDRNWTPQPWQVSPYPAGYQDNANGKEVILVRFTITNLSSGPLGYSDRYFSLVRANGHEQRVTTLAELTGDQYGSFGQTSPWLQSGATVHTFVPFLVNPGEQPQQFVLTWKTIDPNRITTITPKNGKQVNMPVYINVARIPISLSSTSVSKASQGATTSSTTFVPDTTFKVTNTDVYSTTGN